MRLDRRLPALSSFRGQMPAQEMSGRRKEPAHVDADLGDDDSSAEVLDARDRIGAQRRRERAQGSPRFAGRSSTWRIESVDLIEMKAQQEPMVPRHAAAKGFAALLMGRLDPPIGKAGQLGGIGFAGDHRLDHGAAAVADHIGEHESSLMLASSSVFCTRSMWLDRSRTFCLRVRSRPRISWVCVSGTKLARIKPCA